MPDRINLHVLPGLTFKTKEEFKAETCPYSIALDGIVEEGPWQDYSDEGIWRNFNHHEDVDRLATRASCAQVAMAIRGGLFETFRDEHGPRAEVWVNDCDEDVCLSWWLLSNPARSKPLSAPRLNRLLDVVDRLDTTAGAYGYDKDEPVLRELAWIFDPYRRFRNSGRWSNRDSQEFRGVINDVALRIGAHIYGKGESQPLDLRYETISNGGGFTVVKEIGAQARLALFGDGITAFVALRADESLAAIGRKSADIPFPLDRIFRALNEREGCEPGNAWGPVVSGATVGGPPRLTGTALSIEEVCDVIREVQEGE
jgi:hypothetical protein